MKREIEDAQHLVPEHLRAGLLGYLFRHEPVGGFLTSVLTNDLHEAVGRADPASFAALPKIIQFLYACAPSLSWGSEQAVKDWLARADEPGARL